MEKLSRRHFIKASTACGIAACVFGSGSVLAEWPSKAFADKSQDNVLKQLYGESSATPSTKIELKAPEIAENGAVVPINVKTSLKNVESVSILVDKNPNPLAAQFQLDKGSKAAIGTRIKLREKTHVTAIVKADGKLYSASRYVKVTRGGCGG